MPRTLRVAAVVQAPPYQVRDVVAKLPADVTAYVVETGAGVLVTLERQRRLPLRSRRRTIRVLQRELAAIGAAFACG
jgi:hypothetical protein